MGTQWPTYAARRALDIVLVHHARLAIARTVPATKDNRGRFVQYIQHSSSEWIHFSPRRDEIWSTLRAAMFERLLFEGTFASGTRHRCRSLAIVRSTENSLRYSSAPRAPKASRLSDGSARTSPRGSECRGVRARNDRGPGRRRPERLGKVPEVGDYGTRLASPAITLVRRELTPSGYGWRRRSQARRWAATSAGRQLACRCHPPGQVRVSTPRSGRNTARTPGR